MRIIPYFFRKLGTMSPNLSSAAVVIAPLRVRLTSLRLLTLCMLGNFSMLLLLSTDFLKKIISKTLPECQKVWIQILTDALSVLIWVQTVCKVYQQMAKVSTCKERVYVRRNKTQVVKLP